jgi:hypothetical protein
MDMTNCDLFDLEEADLEEKFRKARNLLSEKKPASLRTLLLLSTLAEAEEAEDLEVER